MTLSLILACIWAIAAAITAMLPMRRQYFPGLTLLVSTVPLLIFLGFQHGFWVSALGFAAFLSMFRNPLIYLYKKALGKPVSLPKELQDRMK